MRPKKTKQNFKGDTASVVLACSCTFRPLSCVHKDNQLAATKVTDSARDVGSFPFSEILLLIYLGIFDLFSGLVLDRF